MRWCCGCIPIILPASPRKLIWDLFIAILIIYSALTVPLRIGFSISVTPTWRALDVLVDALFLTDIILAFRTAYAHPASGALIMSPRAIAVRYLRSWFLLDVLSTVPFDVITTSMLALAHGGLADLGDALGGADVSESGGSTAVLRSTKLLRVLRLARLLKMGRLLKLSRVFGGAASRNTAITDRPASAAAILPPSLVTFLKLMMAIAIPAHFLACLFHGVSEDSVDEQKNIPWVVAFGLSPDTPLSLNYTMSLYWALTTYVSPLHMCADTFEPPCSDSS